LFSSPNVRMIKSRTIKWAGHVARVGEKNSNRVSVGKPEGNKPLERYSR
jgi:hypothetical protein